MNIRRHVGTALAAVIACAPATTAGADTVLDWNAIMLRTVAGQNPFAQGRSAAIVQLAVFEAVNAVTGDHRPYLGTLPPAPQASAEAAAVAAAHGVLRALVAAEAANLDAARAASLAALPDGPAKAQGVLVGEAAAAAMLAQRANDGSAPPQFHVPAPPAPGVWQPTPGCPPAGGTLLHWRNVTPFGIAGSAQFRSAPPPSLHGRRYARDYKEVLALGAANSIERPPDRADVARFYAAASAVAAWNAAVHQVAAVRGTTLAENARAFALLNMAINDGLVSSIETKYHYVTWRPHTAILAGDADGNPKTQADATFTPFVATPCFPSYPSAHASASYAALAVAVRLFGNRGHAIALAHAAVPGVVLRYGSFREIARDVDDARVYGGIHFRFDQEAGARQGLRVGRFVVRHHLRDAWPPDDDKDEGDDTEDKDDDDEEDEDKGDEDRP
jgi:PAP2 superfamily protein